jgi:hypothetical protein
MLGSRKLRALLLAGGLTAGTLGLTACHSTNPVQLCNETKPSGSLLTHASNHTVVNGTPTVFHCGAQIGFLTWRCWRGHYSDHSITIRWACDGNPNAVAEATQSA